MKKLICLLLIILTVYVNVAFASVGIKEATLQYVGITINIDNKIISPKDANGNIVNPFIIDGTTYLPVRAVSESLGKKVSWNAENYSVHINDSNEFDVSKTFSRRNN